MADEKKPKIDLKARLGKTTMVGGSTAPAPTPAPPAAVSSVPVGGSARAPAPPPSGAPAPMPRPPGVPVGAPPAFGSAPSPAIDPSNPLAAVATYRAPVSAVPVAAAPQRIEVDEMAVQEARKGAMKKGLVIAVIFSLAFAGIGFVAGGASEQNNARTKSKNDAKDLADAATKAKATLTTLADKMEAARNQILKERKFPDTLAKDLGGLNVDFAGSQLSGRRFSGFPTDTTAQLVDFITGVQSLNDRKDLIVGLLGKLQKPLTDEFSKPEGQTTIKFVTVVTKDPSGNVSALLAPLQAPLTFAGGNMSSLPPKFTFTDPLGGGNAELARYTGGDIANKAAALPVVPKTFEKVCPSETAGAAAQLAAQIGGIIRDIKGEAAAADQVSDTKPGLAERADRLIVGLQKVQ